MAGTGTQDLPAAGYVSDVLESLPWWMYGTSYGVPDPATAQARTIDRLVRRARGGVNPGQRVVGIPPTFDTNRSVNSILADDACGYAFGTETVVNAGSRSTPAAGTWVSGNNVGGIVFLDLLRNSAGFDGTTTNSGTTAKSRQGASNAIDSMIALNQSQSRQEDPASGSVVYSGSWTHQTAQTQRSGANQSFTTAVGASVTITTPVGTDFDLILIGLDDAVIGFAGAAFTVTVDGVSQVARAGFPFTCSNQLRYTQAAGNAIPSSASQMRVPLRGLSSQAHTVVLTHAGSAGQALFFDCLLRKSATPPLVFVMKVPQLTATGYAAYVAAGGTGASYAVDQVYNGLVDTVLSSYSASEVISFDPNSTSNPFGLWTPSTMLAADGIHPNDAGCAYCADNIMPILNALPARAGLVTV